MSSVTKRISEIKQPRGGYVKPSQFEIHKIEDINVIAPKTEVINIIVPSMRMDSIVSEAIRTSRAKAIDIINQERVFINGEVAKKNSKMLKEGDKITVRGKGRFEISKILINKYKKPFKHQEEDTEK